MFLLCGDVDQYLQFLTLADVALQSAIDHLEIEHLIASLVGRDGACFAAWYSLGRDGT